MNIGEDYKSNYHYARLANWPHEPACLNFGIIVLSGSHNVITLP